MASQFIDYLGNPINEGDIIVYPVAFGSSSATLNTALVVKIDPIVRDLGGGWCYESMRSKRNHANISFPQRPVWNSHGYNHATGTNTGCWDREDAPERAYGLKVQKLYEGTSAQRMGTSQYDRRFKNAERLFTLRNVDRVVVVTSIETRDVRPLSEVLEDIDRG